MSFRGDSLVGLFSAETRAEPIAQATRNIADEAGKFATASAKANAARRSGRTAESYQQIPVHRVPGGHASGVRSNYYVARFLEYDVGPHDVEPDDEQAVETPEGPRAKAHHPGHRGTFPVANAMATTDGVLDTLAAPALLEFAREIERRGEVNAKRR